MTLQLLHFEFPYTWGKFYFLFYQCIANRKSNWNTVQVIFIVFQLPLAGTHNEKDDNLGFCLWGHSHIGISAQRRGLRRGCKNNTLRRIKRHRWDVMGRGGTWGLPELQQLFSSLNVTVRILIVKSVFFSTENQYGDLLLVQKCVILLSHSCKQLRCRYVCYAHFFYQLVCRNIQAHF